MKAIYKEQVCIYCGKSPIYAKNLCSSCYQRLRRNGTLEYKVCNKTQTAKNARKMRKIQMLNKYTPTTEKGLYILNKRLSGVSAKDLAKELNVSRQTIYDLLKK